MKTVIRCNPTEFMVPENLDECDFTLCRYCVYDKPNKGFDQCVQRCVFREIYGPEGDYHK